MMETRISFITDLKTVLWKEIREIVSTVGGKRGRLGILVFAGVFGILMPLQTGPDWILTPVGVISWTWLPVLLVSGMIADSIAGERDRHTLETLLAGRLPDAALYTGKIISGVLYGCFQIWLMAILSLAAINIAYWNGYFLFYPGPIAVSILIYPVLLGLLSAGISSLLSIGAETARQAQLVMSAASLVLVLPVFLVNVLPASIREGALRWLEKADWNVIAAAVPAGLMIIALIILFIGFRRFTRIELLKKGG